MVRKLLTLLMLIIALAFIAEHYGLITLPMLDKAPKVLETRHQYMFKSDQVLQSGDSQ